MDLSFEITNNNVVGESARRVGAIFKLSLSPKRSAVVSGEAPDVGFFVGDKNIVVINAQAGVGRHVAPPDDVPAIQVERRNASLERGDVDRFIQDQWFSVDID